MTPNWVKRPPYWGTVGRNDIGVWRGVESVYWTVVGSYAPPPIFIATYSEVQCSTKWRVSAVLTCVLSPVKNIVFISVFHSAPENEVIRNINIEETWIVGNKYKKHNSCIFQACFRLWLLVGIYWSYADRNKRNTPTGRNIFWALCRFDKRKYLFLLKCAYRKATNIYSSSLSIQTVHLQKQIKIIQRTVIIHLQYFCWRIVPTYALILWCNSDLFADSMECYSPKVLLYGLDPQDYLKLSLEAFAVLVTIGIQLLNEFAENQLFLSIVVIVKEHQYSGLL